MQKIFNKKLIYSLVMFFAMTFIPNVSSAAVLLPGNISTCGELTSPGTYTLTQNVSGGSGTCFNIGSDNVTINGGGFTISGTGDTAIDARPRTSYPSGPLTEGADAYTNLIINDLNISGYTTGINASGNADTSGSGQKNGFAGDAGDIAIFYSYIGSIIAQGGDASAQSYGGLGGNVAFTDTDLNLSNSTISLLGGTGTVGANTNGGLDVTYSGTFNTTNTALSAFSFLNENSIEFGSYPGGSWPITNTSLTSCGTLFATTTTTFTLTQDITNIDGTCFTIFGDNITIDGGGFTLSSADASSTDFAILAGNYTNFTLASTTVSDYSNLISSASSVTISGNNIDLSDKYIQANSLTLTYTGALNYTDFSFSTLTNLTINGTSYGALSAGSAPTAPGVKWDARDSNRNWYSITSSADGTKLAAVVQSGRIYTSTDSGATWIEVPSTAPMNTNRNWRSITSSADGTKLAAVVQNGRIYTSSDSGATWSEVPSTAPMNTNRSWQSITSSSDGTKLAAVVNGGRIYTSADSGATWAEVTSSPMNVNRNWWSITSSSDGTKLAAVVYGGRIYTSTDSGATWTEVPSTAPMNTNRNWISITSSSDGTKLAAVVYGGRIYTSTDSGATWTEVPSTAPMNTNRNWYSITSSADGTKLAAVVQSGRIYTSTDSGATWTEVPSTAPMNTNRSWQSITSSADGTKLAALVYGGQIYTSSTPFPEFSVSIVAPTSDSTTWSPFILWSIAETCEYSFDNWTSNFTADCSLSGSDIPNPGFGEHVLSVRGYDQAGNISESETSFGIYLPITITSPIVNENVTTWNPVINWDPDNSGNIINCYYSYNNFTSSSTANCSLTGSDILPPSSVGEVTLSLQNINSNNNIGNKEVTFTYSSLWVGRDSIRTWNTIDSSADGTKLVAGTANGYVYTSNDSGATWTEHTSIGSRLWMGVAISDDGTHIAVGSYNKFFYISNDSGATWIYKSFPTLIDSVHSITMSSSGQKIAAAGRYGDGKVWVSTDYGATWNSYGTVSTGPGRRGIRYSGDGSTLVTGISAGNIEISRDDGVTWETKTAPGSRYWNAFGVSYDGSVILASNQYGGSVWSSVDGGTNWVNHFSISDIAPNGLAVSDNGLVMVIADFVNDRIHISRDSGTTWTIEESGKNWNGITSNTDGTKLAAVVNNGYIYTKNTNASEITINRLAIENNVLRRSWSPLIDWGNSVLCSFSYDNFVSSSTVNCANGGSDINPPSSQFSNVLSILGVDSLSNEVFESIAFEYEPWTERNSYSGSVFYYYMDATPDGSTIVAVTDNSGPIYTSRNYGLTWNSSLTARGRGAAISDDGSNMLMTPYNGYIYRSTNGGVSWTSKTAAGIKNWFTVGMSADGTKAIAGVYGGRLYKSLDSGDTWSEITVAPLNVDRVWKSVIVSDDFTKMFAAVSNGRIYRSTDSGATWSEITVAPLNANRLWESIAGSDDLSEIYGVVNNGKVYRSLDSGDTWEEITTSPLDVNRAWRSISVSGDGTKIYASVINSGYVYSSEDSGTTWQQIGNMSSWPTIKVTADGAKVFVAENTDRIKIRSINSYPIISSPTTSSSVTTLSAAVNWDRSYICEYSYDNSNWDTVSCTGTGSDIEPPTNAGSNTLYVRGYDFEDNVATASVTFTYLPTLSNSISSCGNITSSGTYNLTTNLTNVSGTCFTIGANNVTINGNGYTISAAGGNTSYAITAGSYSNLTLEDITFTGFGGGLVSSNSSVTYSGADIDLSNSTSTVNSLTINFTSTLTAVQTYFSNLTSFVINQIDLWSWTAGIFSWVTQDISSCQTISSPGYYNLTQNITDVAGTCFNIESDYVIIDGNDFTITSDEFNTEYAIVATNSNNNSYSKIGLKDLTIVGFGGGVDARGADGVSGDVTGRNGGNISLHTVTFPTGTISVNVSGGDGFYEDNTTAQGGNSGNIKITRFSSW
jgi:hypothetical protein